MPEINLLPVESKPSGYALKASKTLRRLSLLSIVVLLGAVAVVISVNLFFSFQIKSLQNQSEGIKRQIKALEETEQRLVLIQNRLLGIDEILNKRSTSQKVESLQRALETNNPEVTVLGAKFDEERTVITVGADNSKDVTDYYKSLIAASFEKLEIDSFIYDEKGYQVSIAIK